MASPLPSIRAPNVAIAIPGIGYGEFVAVVVPLAIVAVAVGLALLAGRYLGPRAATLWCRLAGDRVEGIHMHMSALIRALVAALILAIAAEARDWPQLEAIILGFGLAFAGASLVANISRALALPRWAVRALTVAAFVSLVAGATGGLGPLAGILDQLGTGIGNDRISLLNIIQVLIALLVLYAGVRLLSRVINHSIAKNVALDATQRLLAQKLIGVALLIAAFFVGIDIVGLDITALAIFSGAFGLAIGFGFQKTFGNLIAGIILLMDRSIKPGDVIAVGESFGHVTKIGVRAVSIVTRDGKEHLIPNENLMTQEVENWSYSSSNVRIHIPVGVAYDCDLALVQKLMIEAATIPKRVLKSPKPSVWLRAFGESSVDHDILVWISDPEGGVGNVQSEILNRLWVLFKEHGIEIPFPQRDIRIRNAPGDPASEPATVRRKIARPAHASEALDVPTRD